MSWLGAGALQDSMNEYRLDCTRINQDEIVIKQNILVGTIGSMYENVLVLTRKVLKQISTY